MAKHDEARVVLNHAVDLLMEQAKARPSQEMLVQVHMFLHYLGRHKDAAALPAGFAVHPEDIDRARISAFGSKVRSFVRGLRA